MYTLVVVDMQKTFASSRKLSVIRNCKSLLKQAMEDKAGIVFLEYMDYGQTHSELLALTKAYKKAYQINKFEDDGSAETATMVRKHRLPKRLFRVCGVNTTYCVTATVRGLTKRLPDAKIEVIGKACNSIDPTNHSMGLDYLRKLRPNIKVK
jgi:nicotinamidase-related amidase